MPDVSNMARLVRVNTSLSKVTPGQSGVVLPFQKVCHAPRSYQDSIGEAAWLADQFDPEVSFAKSA